jgi:GNAT superfamily N-acetyltransferase
MFVQAQNVLVRPATVADAPALKTVFKRAWLNAYAGILPQEYIDQMTARRDAAWWEHQCRTARRMIVVEVGGKAVGYAIYGPYRGEFQAPGEIYELYVLPSHQGLGFGEHLFEACRHGLDMLHCDGMIVWALADNASACGFYERRGGLVRYRRRESVGGRRMRKIGFFWD